LSQKIEHDTLIMLAASGGSSSWRINVTM